jgi:uncharacterized protein YcbK (DUF882 family)
MKTFVLGSLSAAAIGLFCAGFVASAETGSQSQLELLQQQRKQASAPDDPSLTGLKTAGRGGSIQKQQPGVSTGCFRPALRSVLSQISAHFGRAVIVTSGYRSPGQNRRAGGARHSYHMSCMAADIKLPGVSPGQIARFARSLGSVGGVGFHTYTTAVHVDVASRVATWVHGSRHAVRYAKRRGGKVRVAQR